MNLSNYYFFRGSEVIFKPLNDHQIEFNFNLVYIIN